MNEFKLILLIWNIIVIFIYGLDKLCARRGKRRIRERTLIASSFLLGGVGAMFAMVLFNHKTSKIKFRFLVPLAAVLSATLYFFAVKLNISA